MRVLQRVANGNIMCVCVYMCMCMCICVYLCIRVYACPSVTEALEKIQNVTSCVRAMLTKNIQKYGNISASAPASARAMFGKRAQRKN